MEGGFIFAWSQNIKRIESDRPGNMNPLVFEGPENKGGFILELGLIAINIKIDDVGGITDLGPIFHETRKKMLAPCWRRVGAT